RRPRAIPGACGCGRVEESLRFLRQVSALVGNHAGPRMSESEAAKDDPTTPPWAAGTDTRLHELYPTLTDEQLDLLCHNGTEEFYPDGTWVWQIGDRGVPFSAVLEG